MSFVLRDRPDVRARPALASDIAAITDLVAACELDIDGVSEVHETDVRHDLELAGAGKSIVAEGPEGLTAWATVFGERATADVHPAWRGLGLGTQLLAWSEAAAGAAGHARVRQVVTDSDHAARDLFGAHQYQPIYTSWVLEHALGNILPEVVLPPGIKLRPFEPDDAQGAYRLIEDAFNEWPERTPTTFERWEQLVIGHSAFAPALSRLAFAGDELVGLVLSDDYEGQDEGWVQQLATRATHRHRGIARALLQAAFTAFHATGRRRVGLSTNSRTGALTLYQRLGMRVRRSYTAWARDLVRPVS
jgi:ribosomal protein S18 acetylase RimI-like enzyme